MSELKYNIRLGQEGGLKVVKGFATVCERHGLEIIG